MFFTSPRSEDGSVCLANGCDDIDLDVRWNTDKMIYLILSAYKCYSRVPISEIISLYWFHLFNKLYEDKCHQVLCGDDN